MFQNNTTANTNVNTHNNENTTSRKLVTKSAVRRIRLEDIRIDPSYQRDLKSRHKRIVSDFVEEALGVTLIAEREDGSLWVVDGRQRLEALKKLGHKDLRAEVFHSTGPEHEAEVFKWVNMNRTKLTAAEEFKALLTAHDELAWSIKEAAESEGFTVSTDNKGSRGKKETRVTTLGCHTTLIRTVRHNGIEALKMTLRLIKEAWPGDTLGPHFLIIEGLMGLHGRLGKVVDEKRLLERLKTTNPHKIIYTASQMTVATNKIYTVIDVIERIYNRRLPSRRNG